MSPVEHPARGVVAVRRAQAPASLVQMPVDGVLGEAQLAGDLLGAHVTIDQTKALTLTLGEAVEALDLVGKGRVALIHRRGNFMRTRGVGKPPKH
jgi:hypothetical protein